jgi:hypothetical protein
MKKEDSTYEFVSEEKVDEAFLARIKEEYQTKKKRLEDTNRSTYKDLAKDEEIDKLKKEIMLKDTRLYDLEVKATLQESKKSFWSNLFRR